MKQRAALRHRRVSVFRANFEDCSNVKARVYRFHRCSVEEDADTGNLVWILRRQLQQNTPCHATDFEGRAIDLSDVITNYVGHFPTHPPYVGMPGRRWALNRSKLVRVVFSFLQGLVLNDWRGYWDIWSKTMPLVHHRPRLSDRGCTHNGIGVSRGLPSGSACPLFATVPPPQFTTRGHAEAGAEHCTFNWICASNQFHPALRPARTQGTPAAPRPEARANANSKARATVLAHKAPDPVRMSAVARGGSRA